MAKAREYLKSLVKETKTINKKIVIASDIVDELEYLEKNSNASIAIIIEEALKKMNVIKLAKELEMENENG
jgi:rRNA-processing protein FCF1